MKLDTLAAMVAAGFLLLAPAAATPPTITPFPCVTSCSGSLDTNPTAATPGSIAVVSGYRNPGDGGGGDFYFVNAAVSACNSYPSGSVTGDGKVGKSAITGLAHVVGHTFDITTLRVGELVSASGSDMTGTIQTQPGTEIASIDSTNSNITLTLPLTGTATDKVKTFNVVFTGDNTGTLIVDSTGGNCWQKANYRGEPHEFGAYGDGGPINNPPNGHDDTAALQNWLGAVGNLPATTPNANYPTNFGPWIATIPADYYVSGPLTCPSNAVLQGFANDTSGVSKTQGHGTPTVQIFAGQQFTVAGNAVMTLGPFCRLSGIAVDANHQLVYNSTTQYLDAIDVAGTHAVIDGHSLARNGNYNVLCPAAGAPNLDGLQIKDSQFETSWDAGIVIGGACQNVRLIGDIVENSGQDNLTTGYGVSFSSSDITIANGIIEGSAGANLFANGAQYAIVSNMTFSAGSSAATGASTQAPSVEIQNSTDITLTANRYQGGGADGTINSDVLLSGTLDNITLDGNVYSAKSGGNDANIFPSFIYDVVTSPSAPTLTNVHFYETPEIPPGGVFASAIAQALLAPLQIPQFTNNQLSGLILSNDLGDVQAIDIAAGSAADSSNSTLITLPPPATGNVACTVKLENGGAGGLDIGANMVQPNTTYFVYLIAAAAGAYSSNYPTPSCMASTSPVAPTFAAFPYPGNGYRTEVNGGTLQGGNTVYNITPLSGQANPLAGVIAGDAIVSTDGGATVPLTSITGFSANLGIATTGTVGNTNTIMSVQSIQNIQRGMAIVDSAGCIGGSNYVTGTGGSQGNYTITLKYNATCSPQVSGDSLSVSGARQLVLLGNAAQTASQPGLYISTGYYRMIGALYTDGNKNVVKFTQDGDTFYLNTPAVDIATGGSYTCAPSIGISFSLCPLSVPKGIQVEAFGRVVAGGPQQILLWSVDQRNVFGPTAFPGPPGYTTNSSSTTTSFPFRLYTDLAGEVKIQASANGATANEDTDGWVFHRAQ